jgi:hypothetical protein
MAILERIRSAHDLKNLQADLKVAPTNKQARQTQLEPLQQEAEDDKKTASQEGENRAMLAKHIIIVGIVEHTS